MDSFLSRAYETIANNPDDSQYTLLKTTDQTMDSFLSRAYETIANNPLSWDCYELQLGDPGYIYGMVNGLITHLIRVDENPVKDLLREALEYSKAGRVSYQCPFAKNVQIMAITSRPPSPDEFVQDQRLLKPEWSFRYQQHADLYLELLEEEEVDEVRVARMMQNAVEFAREHLWNPQEGLYYLQDEEIVSACYSC